LKIYIKSFCLKCPNGDATKSYSLWHYCNNPNGKEFTIIRHHGEFSPSTKIENTPPLWCPYKAGKKIS